MAPRTRRQSSDSDDFEAVVGLIIIAVCLVLSCCACQRCCRCCGLRPKAKNEEERKARKALEKVKLGDREVLSEHLRRPKSAMVAYLLLFVGGLVGAQHFYLERLVHGILCAISGNFCMVGYIVDMIALPGYVRTANVHVSEHAKRGPGCCGVLWAITKAGLMASIFWGAIGVVLPSGLEALQLVDFHQHLAKTSSSPFRILDVKPDVSLEELHPVLKQKLKEAPPSPCDKKCKRLQKDKKLAADYVLDYVKGRARIPSWSQAWRHLGGDLERRVLFEFQELPIKYEALWEIGWKQAEKLGERVQKWFTEEPEPPKEEEAPREESKDEL
eukprot:TRINITY_DN13100_c0_g1_i1.p1 TRINITY_DN13100_c0_g1~~TRINITY_DN13100_c0_g1_i1.p1  ORF type:complete len:329 (+),score=77.24 TRINITY_DN13100_c0_g1_i1:105-1091(+)